jgi:hypothetical protein
MKNLPLKAATLFAAAVAFSALVVIPRSVNFGTHGTRPVDACLHNLRALDGAKQVWALERKKATNDVPTWQDIRPYMSEKEGFPTCPSGGKYNIGAVNTLASCTYPGHVLR